MKKIFLSLVIIFAAFICHAQVNEADARQALQLVNSSKAAIGLSADDLNQVIVTTTYFDKSTGLTMVYLQQTYAGIPILKQILPLAFKNGKLVSKAGAFLHHMDQLVEAKTAIPVVSASSAVQSAVTDRKLTASKIPVVLNTKENGRKIEFNDMGVSEENVTAELLWVPFEESIIKENTVSTVSRMRLAWQVYIIQKTSSDYWLVCIDAIDNKTVRVDNLTVYDHWGHPSDTKPATTPALINGTSKPGGAGDDPFGTKNIFTVLGQTPHSPWAVNSSSYRVIPYPAESPAVSAPAIRANPWLAAPGNATTLGWHTGLAATEYDYTRGNNVWAYQDRVAPNNTGTIAKSASSTTALPNLTFDFAPNFTVDPLQETPVPNKQFNVTNLFYWNNIIHDVMYQYGFDEPAHNFQDDNLGRGGVGNDHVNAEAQDASGTNNANFSTPNDGGSGRMQMYLWDLNGVNPDRDGDVDNGIVVHEYGHGISIRLTGGGATVCLSGAEQMGEGWSDYYMLMFTTNWATATASDGFNIPRHLGAYALNNVSIFACPYTAPVPPCTAAPNLGIRHFPYSTNMAVNPWVYATEIPSRVHDRGEIWAATLWDMTWNLIQTRGISPGLYDATGTGGNVIAMRLVTLGLKLQPCSVGFIDGRNAILAADQALYGGANQCLIWEAFARRGMGYSASQGSSGSVTDQTPAFDLHPACLNAPYIVAAGSAITAESCSPANSAVDPNETVTVDLTLSNLAAVGTTNLVATLQATGGITNPSGPQNYGVVVSGTPVTRSFSFTADNLVCGNEITATLQLQDGANNLGTVTYTFTIGAEVALLSENFDGVVAPALPAGWVATNTTGTGALWVTSNSGNPVPVAASAPNSIFIDDPATVSDRQILTPTFTPSLGSIVSFANNYNTELGFDGGVLEISINGGAFTDILAAGGSFISGGYNRALSTCCSNPLPGRMAWTGNSGGFITTTVNLPAAAAGLPCQLKFRMGSDNTVDGTGWRVDDFIIFSRQCCLNTCTPPTITAPTVTQPTCATPSGTIVVNATGGGTLEYSVDNGANWQSSPTFGNLTPGSHNIKVRLQANTSCMSTYSSNPVVLTAATGCCNSTLNCPANIVTTNTAGTCGRMVTYTAPTGSGSCNPCAAPTSLANYTLIGDYNGHRYFRSNFTRSWPNAKAAATSVGAHLVTITSAGENSFLAGQPAWIGLTDELVEGQFKWVTGEPLGYLNWRAGEPNNTGGNEHYAYINFWGGNQWVDYTGYTTLPFIIEFECTGAPYQIAGLPSGSVFPVGVTTNTFAYNDALGNTTTCSFTVTVNDTEQPVLTCPANITTPATSGAGAIVNYNEPILRDNCRACAGPATLPNYTYIGELNGHRYFRSNFTRTWLAARAEALALGAHLVTITSAAENSFLAGQPAWIGLTDEMVEGQFKWVTGEPFVYNNWWPGEPNNSGNEDYVYMNFYGSNKWVDYGSAFFPFIIEFECNDGPVRTAGPASGSMFPPGTTLVTYSYTDAANNIGTCSFNVTVTGGSPPASLMITQVKVADGMEVRTYPNPSAGDFNVQVFSKSDEVIMVRIMDVTGTVKKTLNMNNQTKTLKVGADLPAGVYMAEVTQGQNKQVVKLVKLN